MTNSRQLAISYDHFVDKFKPKKTTDDCYTPDYIYEAVCLWVDANITPLEGRRIVRPFYPGGDFENYDYQAGDIVLDNPPFSIIKRIVTYYELRGIDFFLFCPHLTGGGYMSAKTTLVVSAYAITYANGAKVATSFATNLYPTDTIMAVRGDLHHYLRDVESKFREAAKTGTVSKYNYPGNITSPALIGAVAKAGASIDIPRRAAAIRKARIPFGVSLLLSEKAAAEKAAAEKAAAEKAAAEKAIPISLTRIEQRTIAMLSNDPEGYEPTVIVPPMPGKRGREEEEVRIEIPKIDL